MVKQQLSGNQKYPWDDWFNKGKFTLKNPRDYTCQTHSMAQQVRNAANLFEDVKVSIRIEGTTLEVTVV